MANDLFAGRELCPDGACIGLIGSDGLCRECGRVGTSAVSDPRLRHLELPDEPDEPGDDARDEGDAPAPVQAADRGPNPDDAPGESLPEDFDKRVLCPDGGCIGLVGDDGKCKKCGMLGDPAPVE